MSTKYLGKQFDIHGGGMDLLFPHHESEIAQSTICNHVRPARYWIHNNMITINGKKMGKSYDNVIKLTEMFSGNHPMLEKAYSPMTIRFFILQTHYRGTLDFSNDALQAAEKGLKRLMEAYEWLKSEAGGQKSEAGGQKPEDEGLKKKITTLLNELDDFINDDFNTAKVMANIFELIPVINSVKDRSIAIETLGFETFNLLKNKLKVFIEDILGLKEESVASDDKLKGVMQVLIELRKEARAKKDWATSDKIRNQLAEIGIQLKDEKNGNMSWNLS
jgi:cysteinyl-tRNA synthetase